MGFSFSFHSVICGITEITPRELVAKIRFLNLSDTKTGKSNFYEEFKVFYLFCLGFSLFQ